jgi:FkbM family methyltransferase
MYNKIKNRIGSYLMSQPTQVPSDQYVHKSYSQSGEDLIVNFIFKFILEYPHFNYFDVGAHHSKHLSNTALFYETGLRGLLIEPDPQLFNEIKSNRKEDVCLNVGVSFDMHEDSLDFFIMSSPSLNTFSRVEAERLDLQGRYKIVNTLKIRTVTLNALFEKHFVPDFISIDVEGLDFEIIKSIDYDRFRPKVICVETAEFSPVPPGKKVTDAIKYLEAKNYLNYADTFNNTILIDKSCFK